MSATVSSPVCPIPVKTGLVAAATARATTSDLEGGQVRPRSPAADHGDDVAVAPAEHRQRAGDGGRRTGPLHRDRHVRDAEAEARPRELAEEVLASLGARAGDQPDVQRDLRHGQRGVAPQQSLGLERAQQLGPLRGQTPEQRGDVDLGEDEADLALGPVEVERAAQDHDHPLGELDALLGQPVAQRRPRAAPALHVERGHAAAAPVAPGPVVLGVDQAQIEMARAVVRDVLDLAADPEVAVPGKGLVERTLDLLVEAADGVDPTAVLVGSAGPPASGAAAWRLGIEELTGAAGHRRHPTDALSGHLHLPWWWQNGGDGESARWPRHGPLAGSCRGRSGLHRAGCWLTASRGDPQDSATERKPPMAGLRARTGKGERVR